MTTTIVAGLGRCGSSLTMQLLHAAGIHCLGRYPAFEDNRAISSIDVELVASMSGGAVKVLDPQRHRIPRSCDCRVIWLDRDPVEQAASQVKMLEQVLKLSTSRATRRALVGSNKRDRAEAFASFNTAWPLLVLTFEQLLARPEASFERITRFVPGMNRGLDVRSIVRTRSLHCLELSLLNAEGAA